MAEIPESEYRNIHRSIDQLRSMNERGVLGPLGAFSATDVRASLVHDYKQFNISDLRNNERLEYVPKNSSLDIRGDGSGNNNNNNQSTDELRHSGGGASDQHQDQKPYSSPSTPPTPISIADGQMTDTKVSIQFKQNYSNYILFKFKNLKN